VTLVESLISQLRGRGVKVGLQEAVALAKALAQGLHDSSLDQFYYVSRSLLVHDESHLDDFDQVFSHVFQGVPYSSQNLLSDLREWLETPIARGELTEEEKAALEEIDFEELRRMFEERLKEQKERHDGGSHWIGTGGTSPFGTGGYNPAGVRVGGGGGGRSAGQMGVERRFSQHPHRPVTPNPPLPPAPQRPPPPRPPPSPHHPD